MDVKSCATVADNQSDLRGRARDCQQLSWNNGIKKLLLGISASCEITYFDDPSLLVILELYREISFPSILIVELLSSPESQAKTTSKAAPEHWGMKRRRRIRRRRGKLHSRRLK